MSFKSLKIVDNFYQNNLFFPMPTVAVSTLCEDGSTTIGSYSLVFRTISRAKTTTL